MSLLSLWRRLNHRTCRHCRHWTRKSALAGICGKRPLWLHVFITYQQDGCWRFKRNAS